MSGKSRNFWFCVKPGQLACLHSQYSHPSAGTPVVPTSSNDVAEEGPYNLWMSGKLCSGAESGLAIHEVIDHIDSLFRGSFLFDSL